MRKVKIQVETVKDPNGWENPSVLIWPDGRRFPIDNVLHYTKAVYEEFSGIRYTVAINGAQMYLYQDESGWYIICLLGEENQ